MCDVKRQKHPDSVPGAHAYPGSLWGFLSGPKIVALCICAEEHIICTLYAFQHNFHSITFEYDAEFITEHFSVCGWSGRTWKLILYFHDNYILMCYDCTESVLLQLYLLAEYFLKVCFSFLHLGWKQKIKQLFPILLWDCVGHWLKSQHYCFDLQRKYKKIYLFMAYVKPLRIISLKHSCPSVLLLAMRMFVELRLNSTTVVVRPADWLMLNKTSTTAHMKETAVVSRSLTQFVI